MPTSRSVALFFLLCLDSTWVEWYNWRNSKEAWKKTKYAQIRQRMWLKVFLFSCYIIYFPPTECWVYKTVIYKYESDFFKTNSDAEWLWCCFWSKVPYFSKWSLIVKPIDYTETMTTWCVVCLCLWGPERNYYIETLFEPVLYFCMKILSTLTQAQGFIDYFCLSSKHDWKTVYRGV